MNTQGLLLTSAWLCLSGTLPAMVAAQSLPPTPTTAPPLMQLADRGHPHEKHGRHSHERDERSEVVVRPMPGAIVFSPMQQQAARSYYLEHEHRGFVPPGLAKKGGIPPGQRKHWRIGQPLPPSVVYYTVPGSLAVVLGPPPAGYRYVRVATDILMIAIGTGLVVDAIEDIVR